MSYRGVTCLCVHMVSHVATESPGRPLRGAAGGRVETGTPLQKEVTAAQWGSGTLRTLHFSSFRERVAKTSCSE